MERKQKKVAGWQHAEIQSGLPGLNCHSKGLFRGHHGVRSMRFIGQGMRSPLAAEANAVREKRMGLDMSGYPGLTYGQSRGVMPAPRKWSRCCESVKFGINGFGVMDYDETSR